MAEPKPMRRASDVPTTDEMEAAFTAGKIEPDPQSMKDAFRKWAEPILALAVVGLYFVCYILFVQTEGVKDTQAAGIERGYKNRAVTCQSLIVDNDRTFALTDDCTEPDVMKYLPPEICQVMGATSADGCGTQFKPSPFNDPGVRG